MTNKSFSLVLILTIAVASFSYSQQNIVSQVKEATIFTNQAQISRYQNVRLEKGNNILKFVGLENGILTPTIQVSGTGGITVVSSFVRTEVTQKELQDKAVIKVLEELDSVQKWEELTTKQVQNLEHEKNAILFNKSANGANSGFNLDNMLDLAEYYRVNLNKLDLMIYEKGIKVKEYRKSKNELNEELRKLGYKSSAAAMTVEVIAENAQTVSMKLEYVVQNIGWTPFYEIKTNGIGDKVKAVCKAKIHQNSHVDWKNVALTLSTTSPANVGVLPTVHPWVLRFQNEGRMAKKSLAYSQSNTAYEASAEMEEKSYDSKSMASYSQAAEGVVSREFSISLPYSISGNNGKAAVDLEEFQMEANYLYYSAPKYNCNVFLIANIQEWEKYNFLPGSANLFLDGTFVGSTFINPSSTEDTMSLILGVDKNIVIERTKIKDFNKNALIGGNKKVDMGIQLIVKNKKNVAIPLLLEDQVPVSADSDIEISIKEISKATKEDETGKLTWKETIPAGGTKVFKINYEVKYPKSKPISNF